MVEPKSLSRPLKQGQKRQTSVDNTDVVKIMQQKIDSLESQLKKTTKSLEAFQRIFHTDQIDFLIGAKVKWSGKTIQMSRAIKKLCGSNGYELLRSYGLPFPSVKILSRDLEPSSEKKHGPKCLLFSELPTPKPFSRDTVSVSQSCATDSTSIDIPKDLVEKVHIDLEVDDAAMSLLND